MKKQITSILLLATLLMGCGQQPQGIYDRETIEVKNGQMAVFSHPAGIALVDFISFDEGSASYRWRFLNISNQIETAGTGMVKEDVHRFLGIGFSNLNNSNLYVHVGPISIPWSYRDTSSAFLYYTKDKTQVELVPNANFKTENLSNHRFHSIADSARSE
jgi:hypothetical protein